MKISAKNLRFHLSLQTILWVLFLITILVEILVTYKYLYLNFRELETPPQQTAQPAITIDAKTDQEFQTWLKSRQGYVEPPYKLQQGVNGRENPVAEYK
jgi:heme/copper-type cytochrome/quinol oxidase subunit 2